MCTSFLLAFRELNLFRRDAARACQLLDMKSPVHKVNGVQPDTGNWFLANKLGFNGDKTSTLLFSHRSLESFDNFQGLRDTTPFYELHNDYLAAGVVICLKTVPDLSLQGALELF